MKDFILEKMRIFI